MTAHSLVGYLGVLTTIRHAFLLYAFFKKKKTDQAQQRQTVRGQISPTVIVSVVTSKLIA